MDDTLDSNRQSHEAAKNTSLPDENRRKFLGATAALATLAGAGMATGLTGCKKEGSSPGTATHGGDADRAVAPGEYEIHPGKLDEYYIFSSAGHNGEVRIYGLPSGRTLKRNRSSTSIPWWAGASPTNPRRSSAPNPTAASST